MQRLARRGPWKTSLLWAVCLALLGLSLPPGRAPGAEASYQAYLKLHKHAKQMQAWRISTASYFNALSGSVATLRTDVEVHNASTQAVLDDTKKHLAGLGVTASKLVNNTLTSNASASSESYQAPPYAFQAYLATSVNVAHNTTSFRYSSVALNDGGAYNATTGMFTAPRKGLYWFHVTFANDGGQGAYEANLRTIPAGQPFQLGKVLGRLLCYGLGQYQPVTTTLVKLQPGDKVGVYPMVDSSTGVSWSMPVGDPNCFAGYLAAYWD